MSNATYSLRLSEIYCPFPTTLNKNADKVEQHTAQWVQDFKLVKGLNPTQRYEVSRFSRLAARSSPNASVEDLMIASDFTALMFLLDDHCDEATFGKQPHRLKKVLGQILAIMSRPYSPASGGAIRMMAHDSEADPELEPLVEAMRDIWRRLNQLATPKWLERFAKNFRDTIEADIWESYNRANQLVPDLEAYIAKRALTNGFFWCQDMSELLERINLPPEVLQSKELGRLAQTVSNVCGWFNDIVSLSKELDQGDIHNLVLILRHHRRLDLQTALDQAVEMHNQEVRTFLRLEQELPSFGLNIDRQLKRYVEAMRIWMRSNVDWSLESGRYNQPWQPAGDSSALVANL